MARGTTLNDLIAQVRAEIGQAASASVGQSERDSLAHLIRRTQERLYDEHLWSFLVRESTITLNAGQRYYDFPATMPVENVRRIDTYWGNQWVPLTADMELYDYNSRDSNAGERADPVEKWRVYSDTQFEVWPMPATAGSIRLTGMRALNPLVANADRADLDDKLITLYAAAEKLAGKKIGDVKATLARQRLLALKGKLSKSGSFAIGGGGEQNQPWRGVIVRIAGAA